MALNLENMYIEISKHSIIDVFILVIQYGRFSREIQDSLPLFKDLFGDSFWKHTICVITHVEGKNLEKVKKDYSETL